MLLEYHAKDLLKKYELPLPRGEVIAGDEVPFTPCVLKVQIPRGGRGKAGGIVIAQTHEEANAALSELRSKSYYGFNPEAIFCEEPIETTRELYLALRFDQRSATTLLIAHHRGGIAIEEASREQAPFIAPLAELTIANLATYFELNEAVLESLVNKLRAAYDGEDMLLLEINPLSVTANNHLVCLDAKITLDTAANFRHPERHLPETTANFVIIDPDGVIGTVANGAGLAMATTDILQEKGLKPYNFYDVGGGLAGEAFRVRLRELAAATLEAIVINIFGGITRCDEIARILVAVQQEIPHLPRLLVRLAGTHSAEGHEILRDKNIAVFDTLEAIIDELHGNQQPALPSKRKVLIQGITGKHGRFHTERMHRYGTAVVAGVTPGKGGEKVGNVPVYDSINEAMQQHAIDTSICFVPAAHAATALHEAIDAGIKEIICITEGIPVRDMVMVLRHAQEAGAAIIGPNTPGVMVPGVELLGIISPDIARPGTIGIVSRSGTLTYEAAAMLSQHGLGQREIIGIGGDMVRGVNFIDVLQRFERHPAITQIVLIGEIGGSDEQRAAEYIQQHMTKPVHAIIAGASAPPATQLGHAGAIIGGEDETAIAKRAILRKAGVEVSASIAELVATIAVTSQKALQ